MIDRTHVEYIAGLARLNLTAEEIDSYTRQIGAVLDHVEQLERVDTTGVEPTCFVVPQHDPLRDDVAGESLSVGRALQNGPVVRNGFFAIPKVIS
jgi:aspartyl-tRNA(Asn)/glutamyl-tRNA(Gln) amidotransferase subunit C